MNRICSITKESLGWIVEARTPAGMRVIILSYGTRQEALNEARYAEADPA